jgi:prephenate dehydratase
MKINMCILSHPRINSIDKIKEFRGHPVAIAQCRRTLKKLWPNIPIISDTDEMDTALSAKLLREGKIRKSSAVFASKRAAEIYGLKILVEGAHDDPLNATSFVVIKR